MNSSHNLSLTLAVILLAGCGLSCTRSSQIRMTQAEALKVESVVNEFHSRMNVGEYGRIWEGRFSNIMGNREEFSNYLDGIHQKYGPVTQTKLVKGEVRPFIHEPQKRIADCWFEIQAEKGRYMERIVWHFVGDEDKFVSHTLAECDEQGRLYMNLNLRTGLGPNNIQTTKIPLGGAEPSTK